jgi:non-ribosomal peptide synthetase-like protein
VRDRLNVSPFIYSTCDPDLLRPGLLHELFEQQADAHPESIALVCDGLQLTYRELEQRSNQLARFLQGRGVRRGDLVGLWLPRSLEAYVALLAILKAGAAYVPLDPDYPAARVSFILSDCHARALIIVGQLSRPFPVATQGRDVSPRRPASPSGAASGNGRRLGKASLPAGCEAFDLDEIQAELLAQPANRLTRADTGTSPTDLCYVIYTSGTTGNPKGVEIEHRSACHLVRAEGKLFQVQPSDRVFQASSLAFDASVEEIWLALFAGATLVIGTREMVRSGAALSGMLADAGVTVFSCVPTLLAMMEDDVPTMRLLILGGEACPANLVKRWSHPGRRVFNTYGPTEATVIATYGECTLGRLVTIGRPVPNYTACVLDEQLRPVTPGVAGELCLGGIGLARGYLGRPELTREKFISFGADGVPPQRLYRTGDLVRWTADSQLEFLGRIDTQVKIRGFRVELSEIEAVLLECSGVKAAAVALREDMPGVQQLVGYVVPQEGARFDEAAVRAQMRDRLPPYMVPALLETLPVLPTLPSGKVDRKSLPAPQSRVPETGSDLLSPRTPLEKQLVAAWEKLFAPALVSVRDDFFLDLGGHSLLAARMVSELRKTEPFARLSVLDVYQYPTAEKLATHFQSEREGERPREPKRSTESGLARTFALPKEVPFSRHFLCGAAQSVSLLFVLSFFALQWLAPYLTYTILIEEEYDFLTAVLGAFASLIVFYPLMLIVPIVVKWLLIGRYRPGAYPLWGAFYFRWWFATTIEAAVPVAYLTGTPLFNIYLRLMGARIGRNVHLVTDAFASYDLLSIGEGSSINADSKLLGYTVEDGQLKIGSISIGNGCFVGTRCALRENTAMQEGSALEDLSLLPCGAVIPTGQTWRGSPARSADLQSASGAQESKPTASRRSGWVRFAFGLLHALGLLVFPVLVVAALFPGIVLMNKLNYLDPYYWYLLLAPLVGVSFVALLALEIAALKWVLLGKVNPGHYSLHSLYYVRHWFVSQTLDLSLDILGSLYASVYLTPWYRLLGAKLGYGAEVSTASFISPDLLSIGDESFIADSVSLGAPRFRDGVMALGPNHIGKRSFIGNSAMLPIGTVIGDSVLIGCLSAPPSDPADALRQDTTWMGSPPIFLPQRQKTAAFPEETTFRPSPKLRIQRATIEFIRVIMPSTCFIILISLLFSVMLLLHDALDLLHTLLFFPFLYFGCAAAATGFTIAAKWLLVWRYRPGERPLWSTFVWRNELLNALHEHLAQPFLIGALTGTPFVCWYFRLLGAKIGRRVYMETTDLSEFDLVHIGDEAMLNADCTIQTHLFEDRIMKMSTIDLGPRCKVGSGSLVLYDTRIEEGATLDDLSLLMKGESLPAATGWRGIPAVPCNEEEHAAIYSFRNPNPGSA